jgi:hypothetical protein
MAHSRSTQLAKAVEARHQVSTHAHRLHQAQLQYSERQLLSLITALETIAALNSTSPAQDIAQARLIATQAVAAATG